MKIKIDKLDVLFSRVIRLRADNHCEYCGKYFELKKMECSHFYGRRMRSVRWDLDNAAALCFTCHNYIGENPYIHTEWFRKRLGSEKFDKLTIRANVRGKVDRDAIEKNLKDQLEMLDGYK